MEPRGELCRGRLVGVGDGDEDGAVVREPHTRGALGLAEGGRKVIGDPHHLAGALHLRPEHRVDAREARERHHRLLDAHLLGGWLRELLVGEALAEHQLHAIFASGAPIALLTNGTVRDARGLASST